MGLPGGEVSAFEASVRWEHPELGTVRPAELIPRAERERSIPELGTRVLEPACALAAAWPADGASLAVHVNLSGSELADAGLPERVRQTPAQTRLEPAWLCLEVSERTVNADPERTAAALRALRETGVALALDDLGPNMPPLAALTELPVEVVKIDRSVTYGIGRRPRDRALVAAVLTYCDVLGIRTIAEGAEDAGTASTLADIGCTAAQGYHLTVPHPAEVIADLLSRRPSRPTPSG